MRPSLAITIGCMLLGALATAEAVNLARPGGYFGNASPDGYFHYWLEAGEADFGGGLSLPVRFQFSSDRSRNSPHLGYGWRMPLMESTVERRREDLVRVNLLCGKHLYLQVDRTDPNRFRSLDRTWHGRLEDQTFILERDGGWQLIFREGLLRELTTDQGRRLTWVFSGRVPVAIQEMGGREGIRMNYDPSARTTRGFTTTRGECRFAMDQAPMARPVGGGRVAIEGFEPFLAGVELPGGKREMFEYRVEEDGTVVFKVDRTGDAREAMEVSWDLTTRYLKSDGEWSYEVEPPAAERAWPVMRRTNRAGEEERFFYDVREGVRTYEDRHGVKTVERILTVPGPLYRKVELVEVHEDGEKEVLRRGFDTAGRVIMRETARGVETYEYDEDGRRTHRRLEGELEWERAYDDHGRMVRHRVPGSRTEYYQFPAEGGRIKTTLDHQGREGVADAREADGWNREWYDEWGRLVRTQNHTGTVSERLHDGEGRLRRVLLNGNLYREHEYDDQGRLSRTTEFGAGEEPWPLRIEEYDYSRPGRKIIERISFNRDGEELRRGTRRIALGR